MSHERVAGSLSGAGPSFEASDRDLVDGLLAATTPSDEQLVDAARLLIRYDGFSWCGVEG